MKNRRYTDPDNNEVNSDSIDEREREGESRSEAHRERLGEAELLLQGCPLITPNSRFKYLIRHGVEQGVAVTLIKKEIK